MKPVISASCSLVISPQGLVLSVSRKDNPTDFGLPGGKREGNETPKQTAIRETFEETRVKLFPEYLVPIYAGMGRKFYCATYYSLGLFETTTLDCSERFYVSPPESLVLDWE